MENELKSINKLITADNIALLSVIITILIFIISRHIEIRYKRHDDKKIQYLKLIDLMQKSLSDYKKNRKGEPVLTDEMKKHFFDTGASLLLYGSKKISAIFEFTVIRKYSQQLIINAGKQCAKKRQAFSFLERMSVYFCLISDRIIKNRRKEISP